MSFLRPAIRFSQLTIRGQPTRFDARPLSSSISRFAQDKGTEGTSTKESPEDASAKSGGSRSKEAAETGSSPTGGQVGNTGIGASPKIHDSSNPSAEGEEYQKEVEQHNKEFEERYDRAAPAEEDKVDKKFWSGQGGAHKDP